MKVKRFTTTAQIPTKGHPDDAGWDLYCDTDEVTLLPGERVLVSTGCGFAIPKGYYGQIFDRSSMAWKQGIHTMGGVIDSSYRGEVKVVLINLGKETVRITRGDRIAQMVIIKINQIQLEEVTDLCETERGDGGFGSTGK